MAADTNGIESGRRWFLTASGVATATLIAGCTGGDDDSTGGDDAGDDGGGGDGADDGEGDHAGDEESPSGPILRPGEEMPAGEAVTFEIETDLEQGTPVAVQLDSDDVTFSTGDADVTIDEDGIAETTLEVTDNAERGDTIVVSVEHEMEPVVEEPIDIE